MSSPARFVGSILFTLYLFISVLFFGIAALLAGIVSRECSYRVAVSWARAALYFVKLLCGLDYTVAGMEHLNRENCVVLVKHTSAWETIAQFVIFPRQTWVMKRELLWAPVLGWVLRIYQPIAIDRKAGRAAVEQVVSQGRERLQDGNWIIIFPEGTRVPHGQAGRYGMSGAVLAIDTNRPVIPVAHNAGIFWPRRSWSKRPGKIRVVIGAPIESSGRNPRDLMREVQDWIESTVATLSDV
jgi:1-acyl-sn-glycerol-3-phosphate acyltransferase